MLSRDKRLPLDTWNTSGLQKTFLVINFLQFIRPEIVIKEINSNANICKKAVDCEFIISGGYSAEFLVGQQRQQISELQFDKFPAPFFIFMLEDKIQKPSDFLF